jgi:hypothetical protein
LNPFNYFKTPKHVANFMTTLKNQKAFDVDVVRLGFEETLKFFDMEQHKDILMIYVAKANADPKVAKLIEEKVLNHFAQVINAEFAFTPILDSSPEIVALNQVDLPPLNHPAFVFLTHDVCDKLALLKVIDLDDILLANPEDLIPNLFEEAFNAGETLRHTDKEFVANLQHKREEHEYIATQGGYHDFDNQANPQQPPTFSKTYSYERRMKSEQDKLYEQLIEKQKENLRKKEEEAERIAQEKLKQELLKRNREAVREKFLAQSKGPGPLMTICFRLPNGRREKLDVLKANTIGDLKEYVSSLDDKGFNNDSAGCDLLHGFPPQPLAATSTLVELFGDSDEELFHVKELL